MSVRRERKREEVGSVGIHSGLEACEEEGGERGVREREQGRGRDETGRDETERRTLKLRNDFSIFPSLDVNRSSVTSVGAPNYDERNRATKVSWGSKGRERGSERDATNLDVSVPREVKHSKATNVSHSIHVNSELPEEVDDRWCARRKRQPEDEGRKNDR